MRPAALRAIVLLSLTGVMAPVAGLAFSSAQIMYLGAEPEGYLSSVQHVTANKAKKAKPDRCKEACRLVDQCKSNPTDADLAAICSDPAQLGELTQRCSTCSNPPRSKDSLTPPASSPAPERAPVAPQGATREAPRYRSAKPDRCKQACRLAEQCKSNPKDPDISSICSDDAQLGELNKTCASCSKPTSSF